MTSILTSISSSVLEFLLRLEWSICTYLYLINNRPIQYIPWKIDIDMDMEVFAVRI